MLIEIRFLVHFVSSLHGIIDLLVVPHLSQLARMHFCKQTTRKNLATRIIWERQVSAFRPQLFMGTWHDFKINPEKFHTPLFHTLTNVKFCSPGSMTATSIHVLPCPLCALSNNYCQSVNNVAKCALVCIAYFGEPVMNWLMMFIGNNIGAHWWIRINRFFLTNPCSNKQTIALLASILDDASSDYHDLMSSYAIFTSPSSWINCKLLSSNPSH